MAALTLGETTNVAAQRSSADSVITALTTHQDTYYAANGRYLKLPWSHDTIPLTASAVAPDNSDEVISGYTDDWDATSALAATERFRYKCNEYKSPRGDGWILYIESDDNGEIQEYTAATGGDQHSYIHVWGYDSDRSGESASIGYE